MPKTDSPNSHDSNTDSPKKAVSQANSSQADSSQTTDPTSQVSLKSFSAQALAEALAQKLAIAPNDWHRLSANRSVRAREQAAAALVYMLKDKPEEAIPRLTQSIGWLNKTLKAPPCPTHGEKRAQNKKDASA